MPENNSDWRRRHALQIAAQLPEDVEDALAVLDLARELVEKFLQVPVLSEPSTGKVVREGRRVLPFRGLAAA